MKSTEQVLPGLPPGLWLPTIDEPTDQYLSANFYTPEIEYDDIVDLGGFMVALAMYDEERVNYRPTKYDFKDMYAEGYGIPLRQLRDRGGLSRLQLNLGYYPDGYLPERDQLAKRFKWLGEYGYQAVHAGESVRDITFDQLVLWGSRRGLLPSKRTTYKVLAGDSTDIRKKLGMERRHREGSIRQLDLFRFGAKILAEQGQPVSSPVLQNYANEQIVNPYETIRWNFDSQSKFWLEFGYVADASGLTKDDLIAIGVWKLLSNPSQEINHVTVAQMSALKVFPSSEALTKFGGIVKYREVVMRAYQEFEVIRTDLLKSGVGEELLQAISSRYVTEPEFTSLLVDNIGALKALSSPQASYIASIIENGFDLLNDDIFEIQTHDFTRILRKFNLSETEIEYIYSLVPRISYRELSAYKAR